MGGCLQLVEQLATCHVSVVKAGFYEKLDSRPGILADWNVFLNGEQVFPQFVGEDGLMEHGEGHGPRKEFFVLVAASAVGAPADAQAPASNAPDGNGPTTVARSHPVSARPHTKIRVQYKADMCRLAACGGRHVDCTASDLWLCKWFQNSLCTMPSVCSRLHIGVSCLCVFFVRLNIVVPIACFSGCVTIPIL